MLLRRFWEAMKDFFTGRRLLQAKRRHKKAADGLDTAVKEMMKK